MIPPIVVSCGWATHAGLRRTLNEDSLLVQAPLFLVADGMGGHQAGEEASAGAIQEFAGLVGRPAVALDDVRFAIARAKTRIDALSDAGTGRAGTTLSGVAVASVDGVGYWLAVNIGDSRTYRLSDGELEQITVDHSVVQELIDAGELLESDARGDRRRNIITRALGAGSTGEADYWMLPAETGDRILVCSDGLSSEVGDDVIARILSQHTDPQVAADHLVSAALEQGGRDNITAVVVDAVHVRTRPQGAGGDDTIDIDVDTLPRAEATGGVQ
ncbi:PP2C family protein-serine/threonine phosphatase [Microbacterium sp. NPDC057659]|uniref:PP2C family protein-serine/threonine phosphatase n=1 Tax=Microbacterium sp. NPDC057659 TaxID=3346198 RepID=UPI00366D4C85